MAEILKKLTAIFFFTLFLLNSIGYRIMYFYAQKQSDKKLEASLNKNRYDEADLITIKVALSLPYVNNQINFERVDGEISFNGKIYKYVKRKIENGSLVIKCLPDYNKMTLKKQKEDFNKDINNVAQNTGSKKQENSKGNSFKNILSEYDQSHYMYAAVSLKQYLSHSFLNPEALLSASPHSSPEQPPEVV